MELIATNKHTKRAEGETFACDGALALHLIERGMAIDASNVQIEQEPKEVKQPKTKKK